MLRFWIASFMFGALLSSSFRLANTIPWKINEVNNQLSIALDENTEGFDELRKHDKPQFALPVEEKDNEEEKEVILDRIARVNDAAMKLNINELETNELKDKTLHEGDIVMNDTQYSELLPHGGLLKKRVAFRQHWFLWTSKVIPFEIDPQTPLETVKLINQALNDIREKTCLTFTPRTRQLNWIRFTRQTGCWSYIGRQSIGAQNISIGVGCDVVGIIQHEIMHALGFFHEQSRPDRDSFVSIFWENILAGQGGDFVRYANDVATTLGIDYDYESVMHYGNTYYSKNGKPTVLATPNFTIPLGQRHGLSVLDYAKINIMYDCSFHQLDSWIQWSLYSPCDTNCHKRRQRFCFSEHPGNCNGALPSGIETEFAQCPYEKCYAPVDGHWGRWSRFTACSANSCGIGSHRRDRLCNDPSPAYGGKECSGNSVELKPCRLRLCDVGPYGCDFTNDTCNWQQSTLDSFDWTRKSEGTPSINTGPCWDHTGLIPGVVESFGHFMYIEASGKPAGYRARLQSGVIQETGISGSIMNCLSFFYHMYGPHMGELNIYQRLLNGREVLIWKKSGNQGEQWHHGNVSFAVFQPIRLVFEGIRGSGYTSDIAIDDITVTNSACENILRPSSSTETVKKSTSTEQFVQPATITATFVSPSLTLADISSTYPFNLSSRSLATLEEKLLRVPVKSPMSRLQSKLTKSEVQINFVNERNKRKLSASSSVLSNPVKTSQDVGLEMSSYNDGFSAAEINTGINELNCGFGYNCETIVTDTKLQPVTDENAMEGNVMSDSVTTAKGNCFFENGFCNWTQGNLGDILGLKEQNAKSHVVRWRLSKDSVLGTGTFIYVNSVSSKKRKTQATLVSPLLRSDSRGTCMTLSVRFYGNVKNHVLVYIIDENKHPIKKEIIRASQLTNWVEHRVFVMPDVVFSVIVSGVVEGILRGERVAIGHVEFTPGSCGALQE